MARADLLKRLFEAYQRRDDQGFRLAANELVDDERKKHHAVVANELQRSGKKYALLGICAAGGLGAAAVLERVG